MSLRLLLTHPLRLTFRIHQQGVGMNPQQKRGPNLLDRGPCCNQLWGVDLATFEGEQLLRLAVSEKKTILLYQKNILLMQLALSNELGLPFLFILSIEMISSTVLETSRGSGCFTWLYCFIVVMKTDHSHYIFALHLFCSSIDVFG